MATPAQRIALTMSLTIVAVWTLVDALAPRGGGDLGPPGDLRRVVAFLVIVSPAVVAAAGAVRRRPALMATAGALCLPASYLSAATLWLVVPGLVLIGCAIALDRATRTPRRELAIAVVVGACLVAGTGLALLRGEERCWTASGSPSDPVYSTAPGSADGAVPVHTGSVFASGCDGGFVSPALAAPGLALLAAAWALAWLPGHRASDLEV